MRKLKRGRPGIINGQKTGHKYEVHHKDAGFLSAWSNMEDAKEFISIIICEGESRDEYKIKRIY